MLEGALGGHLLQAAFQSRNQLAQGFIQLSLKTFKHRDATAPLRVQCLTVLRVKNSFLSAGLDHVVS